MTIQRLTDYRFIMRKGEPREYSRKLRFTKCSVLKKICFTRWVCYKMFIMSDGHFDKTFYF